MRGLRGVGLRGLADPVLSAVCLSGINPWKFDPTLVSMTASMAKRLTSVFAASPIVQGRRDGTGTPDVLSLSRGAATVAGSYFYPNFDANQGSVTFRWTPEKATNAAFAECYTFFASVQYSLMYIHNQGKWKYRVGTQDIYYTAAVVAGTTYNVCIRWDTKNTLDGTNYACISINDTHTFGITTRPTVSAPDSTWYIGSNGGNYAADASIEGLTIYRRVLYDGTYGVNVGNGDEVALIAAGVDPTTVTGSWDVCFCLPTNASTGALTTGTGNAWSHPHSSNLLTRGFLSDRYYGGTNQWAVKFNGTTSVIDCGSGATLDDIPSGAELQFEAWVRGDTVASKILASKGDGSTSGWLVGFNASSYPYISVSLATTDATASYSSALNDGKWHHLLFSYNDTTKVCRVAVDGVWGTAGSAGNGAYQSDAASSVKIGGSGAAGITGSIGWIILHNDAHYTPGTNFVPPRTMPAADVEGWALNEGTGTTATASVTTPGNDGTIANGTWEQQWLDEGSPVMLQSVIGSTSYNAAVGSDAAIDDMADNAFTADGWFIVPKTGAVQYLTGKGTFGTNGWAMQVTAAGLLSAKVECATTDATVASTSRWDDNLWHYFKMTFDDAGDRKVYIYVDNVDVSSGAVAGVGAIVSDAAQNGYIGYTSTSLTGAHGWVRWSNSVRGAGMIERSNPPAVDGNTLGQWNCTEGAGAVLDNAETTATRDGAITGTYSWNNSPAMESDSPGARQYGWGYVVGSDAANEGTKQVYSGLTAGSNYVLNAWAYSEDSVAQPCVVIYDETNGAEITRLAGTTTSTEKAPDRLNFSFEIPTIARNGVAADCTSISIKLINLTATGVVGWQQIELLTNLLDNPSLDTGAVADPWIPDGMTNSGLDAGDTEKESVITHSSGGSLQANAGASIETLVANYVLLSEKFYGLGFWGYNSGNVEGVYLYDPYPRASPQTAASSPGLLNEPATLGAAWTMCAGVIRAIATAASSPLWIRFVTTAVAQRYLDDMYQVRLDDVSLTCTPASAANSVESSGIRVDGYDSAPQTIPANSIFANQGWIKFAWIPRHSAADVAKFGNATPAIAQIYGDADDYITLDWSAANTIRLSYNANGAGVQTGTWNATGAIVAGTTYQVEIKYTGSGMELIVDGTSRITITAAVAFGTVPTAIYPGSLQAGGSQVDAVFLAPT